MPHHFDLILTLAGALAAALLFGLIARRIGLSPIVGYLVAGIAVGPFTPGIVVDRAIAEQLSELSVVILMFGVGLHFRVKDLLAARSVALPGALIQVAVATALGAAICVASGWSAAAGVVFGVSISVAGTVLLTHVLAEHDALHTPAGRIAVGWTLVEDLFTVLVLVVLPVLAEGADRSAADVALALAGAALKVMLLVAFTAFAGRRAIPALLAWVAKMRSRELFTLSVFVLALGIAVGSSFVFGASMALGAFLAGMVVAQSEVSARAASEALPMRDAFAVLFFVSVGMLLDPAALAPNLPLTTATIVIVLVAKPLVAYLLVRLLRRPHPVAIRIAIALGQIGEFSFVLAALAGELGIVPAEGLQVIVATSIVSITLNPPAFRILAARIPIPDGLEEASHRVVVIGYDAVGRTLTRLLRENGVAATVIDLNLQIVRALQRDGVRAVHGDASQREVLERAGVRGASSVLVASSGTLANAVIRAARALSPDATILVRPSDLEDVAAARAAGAHVVDAAEPEVALEMTMHVLERLGATADQLDRVRHAPRGSPAPAA